MQSLEIGDSKTSDLYQRMKQLLSDENPIHSSCKFSKKPPSQTMIAAAEPGSLPTSRILFIIDLNTRRRYLVDSGAEISLIPPKPERLTPNPNFVLQAVNRSNINTHGQKLLELDPCLRRTFRWIFVVADVPDPILGADFYTNSISPLAYEPHSW